MAFARRNANPRLHIIGRRSIFSESYRVSACARPILSVSPVSDAPSNGARPALLLLPLRLIGDRWA